MPAAGSLEPVRIVPELMVPKASTEISLVDGTTIGLVTGGAGAGVTAPKPAPAEVMLGPAAVGPLLLPLTPFVPLTPIPKTYSRMAWGAPCPPDSFSLSP